ncbi:hypothetical protein MKY88_24295 [Lysinibacillus sp. FSL R7-0073]|uniref:hypothetical protein n=1 Tax=Lysinibacillus TaxID=400634 RepID=UPI002E1D3CD2|nr:hypothetical protein [Lysinibacillus fusiformis]
MTKVAKMEWVFDVDESTHYADTLNPVNDVSTDIKKSIANLQWIADTDMPASYVEWVNPNNEVLKPKMASTGIEFRIDEDTTEWYKSSEFNSSIIYHKKAFKLWNKGTGSWETTPTLPTDTQFIELAWTLRDLNASLKEHLLKMNQQENAVSDGIDYELFSQIIDLNKCLYIDDLKVQAVMK